MLRFNCSPKSPLRENKNNGEINANHQSLSSSIQPMPAHDRSHFFFFDGLVDGIIHTVRSPEQ